jgi:hypothetical protein
MEELLVFVTPKILPKYQTADAKGSVKVDVKDATPVGK